MSGALWTEPELERLAQLFPREDETTVLAALPGRTWPSIAGKAHRLGMVRRSSSAMAERLARRQAKNAEALLSEELEAYYWAGFIAADGALVKRETRLRITLQASDAAHLQRLADYVGGAATYTDSRGYFTLSFQNPVVLPAFARKFDLRQAKTYRPPQSVAWMDDDQFIAFFAGLVDGDGCVRTGRQPDGRSRQGIILSCHVSWLPLYEEIGIRLFRLVGGIYRGHARTESRGYACLRLSGLSELAALKRWVLRLGLPVLPRKWDAIDETAKGKRERRADTKTAIKQELATGCNLTTAAQRTGVCLSYAWMIMYEERTGQRYERRNG